MSQATRVARLVQRVWLTLHEPPIVTATMMVAWVIVALIGLTALIIPPPGIQHVIGPWLTLAWASFLLLGGALGLGGCPKGIWWLERIGITSTILGIVICIIVIASLPNFSTGYRAIFIGFLILAILFMLTRWERISGAMLDPRGGLQSDRR